MSKTISRLICSTLTITIAVAQAAIACPPGQMDTPPRTWINTGLTSPTGTFMTDLLGKPIDPSPPSPPQNYCYPLSSITNGRLKKLLVTEDVGPFSVTGLKPAVETLKKIFAEVRQKDPNLYSQLRTDGMFCARPIKHNGKYVMGTWSNHSWGVGVDIKTKNQSDTQGDKCTLPQLRQLYPYFHQEGFYWGAGYSTLEDSMHFEASQELLQKWKNQGLLD